MIVYELEDSFCLITQTDHADLSGQLFDKLDKNLIPHIHDESLRKATYEHDRGWKSLDDTPIWNDQQQRPYSFLDFPLAIKLLGYQNGISQTEKEDPYAGLLCSMHYAEIVQYAAHDLITRFIGQETQRQLTIRSQLKLKDDTKLLSHFHVLQFLDRFSLFLCFRENGISPLREFPWYEDGFASSNHFIPNRERIHAHWTDAYQIKLSPFLFLEDIEVQVRTKYVKKFHIQQAGLVQAYQDTHYFNRTISIKS